MTERPTTSKPPIDITVTHAVGDALAPAIAIVASELIEDLVREKVRDTLRQLQAEDLDRGLDLIGLADVLKPTYEEVLRADPARSFVGEAVFELLAVSWPRLDSLLRDALVPSGEKGGR